MSPFVQLPLPGEHGASRSPEQRVGPGRRRALEVALGAAEGASGSTDGTVKETKTNNPRRIPIEPPLVPLLRRLLAETPGRRLVSMPPACDLSARLRQYLKWAGVTRATRRGSGSPSTIFARRGSPGWRCADRRVVPLAAGGPLRIVRRPRGVGFTTRIYMEKS